MTIKPPGGAPPATARAALASLARVARHVDVTTSSGATALARLRELDTLCTVGKGTMMIASTFGGPRNAAAAQVDTPMIVDAMGHAVEPMGVMDAIVLQRSGNEVTSRFVGPADVDVISHISHGTHRVEAPEQYGFRLLAPRVDDNGDPLAPRFEVPTPGVHVRRFTEVPGVVVEVHDTVSIMEKRSASEPLGPDRFHDETHWASMKTPDGAHPVQPFGAKRIVVDRDFVVEAEVGKRVEVENAEGGGTIVVESGERMRFDQIQEGAWRLSVIDVDSGSIETANLDMPMRTPRAEVLHGGFGVELVDTNGNSLKPRLIDRNQKIYRDSRGTRRIPGLLDRGHWAQKIDETVVYEDPQVSLAAGHLWPMPLTWREHPFRADGLKDSRWPSAFHDAEVSVNRYKSGSLEVKVDDQSFFLPPYDNQERGMRKTRPEYDIYRGYIQHQGEVFSVEYRFASHLGQDGAPGQNLKIEPYDGNARYLTDAHGIDTQ